MNNLAHRRSATATRLDQIRALLKGSEARVTDRACVYATGSFGRREASPHSDLDVFVVGLSDGKPGKDAFEGSKLSRLDEICVLADLVGAIRELGIPDFDGDGRYLVHYSTHHFTKTLGRPEDDATNTFTARLLMLLESTPLIGQAVHQQAIDEVLGKYWRDYADHRDEFVPGFLANDILRLWRTFCVNYEARTEVQPAEKKAKRKLKNYKLKYSRLLTCYSALLFLLGKYGVNGTVSPQDAIAMTQLSPTERLEWILSEAKFKDAHPAVIRLLAQYDEFLGVTNAPEDSLIATFLDKSKGGPLLADAYNFGDSMFDAIEIVGARNRFHRLLVV